MQKDRSHWTGEETEFAFRLIAERNEAEQILFRHLLQAEAVILSVATPLAASHPPSGTARWLMAAALSASAISLLAYAVLLRVPMRQCQAALEEFLKHRKNGIQCRSPILTPPTSLERWCRRIAPAAATLSILGLLLSATVL